MPLEVIVFIIQKCCMLNAELVNVWIFWKVMGKFEDKMLQVCWFVLVSIGIVVVVNVTILSKYTILAMFVVIEWWIADY